MGFAMRGVLLGLVVACGGSSKPPPQPETPVVQTEPPADAGSAASTDPCLPAFDVVVSTRCYVDEFCACPDKTCGVAVYQRYRRMMDTVGSAQDTQGFAQYQAIANRMAQCSSGWK